MAGRIQIRLRGTITWGRPAPRSPEPEAPQQFEHRDTEAYVEPGPSPRYPLGFMPADE